MGLVVSTGPPVEGGQADTPTGDKKKQPVDVVCREKNTELARYDVVISAGSEREGGMREKRN